ncbi:hypothetical protein TWF694_007724 [Orbilia ellipsospora]|uniref:Thioesterase domain-containing protein n=1 Tax=Orbilia ellipsospora TaxID=2528407 RepID=A0AAV9XIP5_9PEZI
MTVSESAPGVSFMEQNPSIIQPYGSGIPLVLIHDGGGTTYSYHGLKSLDRPVYGIHNPRFYSGRAFKGGIPEMARIYAQLIELLDFHGRPFIIGGWSLGGLIALEITRALGTYPYGPIAGTIMIDSPCPVSLPEGMISEPRLRFHDHCRLEIRLLVQLNMKVAVRMLQDYVPPTSTGDWHGEEGQNCTLLYEESNTKFLPHVTLLKAEEYSPTTKKTNAQKSIALVDYFRELTALGWEKADCQLISDVLPIPGNHFDLFMEENLESTSNGLIAACEAIELSLR